MNDTRIFSSIIGSGDNGAVLSRHAKYTGLSNLFEQFLVEAAAVRAEPESNALDAFQKEFHDWLDTVPVHISQSNALMSITIDDKAFEKMMVDADFKQEVQDLIVRQLGAEFAVPPAFTTMRIDENGVYSGTAGGSAHLGWFANESRNAFWTRGQHGERDTSADKAEAKRNKRKKLEELLGKLAEDRRLRRLDAAENYFYRFTAQNQGGMPYRKSSPYASPPLDLSCLASEM
ncbi:MAG: hypothetical protein LUE17_06960 [Planctomycetaceae bacterium]|nr:hypothetical protein [Planctomycetaceae bacterium]